MAYRIPFQKKAGVMCMMDYTSAEDGKLRTSLTGLTYDFPDEWRENVSFYAELVLDGCWKGRSAVRFGVINVANLERYSLGQVGFYDAILLFGCRNKTICGTWKFKKQGSNFGLVPVKTEGR
jgi:hypothetical protein